MASQTRVPFGTFLAFRIKDAVSTVGSKRAQKVVSYYAADGTRKHIKVHMYTDDPEGYHGPDVMECIRPDDPNLKKKKKKKKDDREPERSPEPLHLYCVVGATGKKLAHIPLGTEGDEYLLDFLTSIMEEMEENGENVFDALFNSFVERVKEHFDVLDIETRLGPICKHAKDKFLSTMIESHSMVTDEAFCMIEDNRENIAANSNRLSHVENRVDDVDNRLDDVDNRLDDVDNRVNDVANRVDDLIKYLQGLHLQNGTSAEQFPFASSLSPPPPTTTKTTTAAAPLQSARPMRAARKQKLDQDDLQSFQFYTESDGYQQINPPIRDFANGKIDALPRTAKKWKGMLEKALGKLLDNYVGTVYRGVNMDEEWIQDIKKTFTDNTRARVPFSDPAFLSTSTKLDSSFKDTNCRFIIRSKTGKEIAPYSVHPFEYEVLFAPNTNFVIHDIVILDTKLLVRMREI